MTSRILTPALALTLPITFAQIAAADDVFTDDVIIINDGLCLGPDCADGETFGPLTPGGITTTYFKLKGPSNLIHFDDTSTSAFAAKRDWQLTANDATAGTEEAFLIEDLTAATVPFKLLGQAPTHAFVIDDTGFVGMGTNLPAEQLHIAATASPTIRMEQTTSGGEEKAIWDLVANDTAFFLRDNTELTFKFPFYVEHGAPSGTLLLAENGWVGMGKTVGTPDAPFELYSNDTYNFFRITAAGASTNQSADITFTGGTAGTGELRYNIVDGDNQEMSLDADGNMVLDGTLTTSGPTCPSGCDAVFEADYPLPSITEHAAQMYAAGYLPVIGATLPYAPVNLSERQGNIINSLEHAHIYIDQLNTALSDEKARALQREAEMRAELDRQNALIQKLLMQIDG